MLRKLPALVLAALPLTSSHLGAGTVTGTVLTKPTARQKVPPR